MKNSNKVKWKQNRINIIYELRVSIKTVIINCKTRASSPMQGEF